MVGVVFLRLFIGELDEIRTHGRIAPAIQVEEFDTHGRQAVASPEHVTRSGSRRKESHFAYGQNLALEIQSFPANGWGCLFAPVPLDYWR